MMRRKLFLFTALLAAIKPARAVPKNGLVNVWNDFAAAVREWTPAAKEYVDSPGESPINMQRKWEAVRKAFREVDIIVRNQ